MKSIYDFNYATEIDPPLILSASLTQNQTLVIETSSSNLMAGSNNYSQLLAKIQDDFVLTNANGVSVNSFQVQGGSLILGLNGDPGTSAKISFIGKHSGISNNITNPEGLELVCFSDFPIFDESNQNLSALIFVNNDPNDVNSGVSAGKIFADPIRGASRNVNGNDNANFGNIGDWSVDMTISQYTGTDAATTFGAFKDNQHPVIDYGVPKHSVTPYDVNTFNPNDGSGDVNRSLYVGADVLTQDHGGHGALGWGSFAANAYNRATGAGAVAMGFNNIAGDPNGNGNFGLDPATNAGQTVFGYASRATGQVSFASGFRNTASGTASVAMGNFNYASGDSSVAIGKESYAQGASAIAIGFKSHAAGGGSVALGQENVSWGSTNFTSGYQNVAGDTSQGAGSGGSAVAMGKYNIATADTSMALNRGTAATNQAATSMGFRTIADNAGMLAIGVNNAAGIGDTESGRYFYTDGAYNGAPAGVAFVIGNGDINTQAYARGNNPSNAFIVKYDGSATLAGDLTVNSDARLKSNIVSLGSTLAKLMQIDGKSYTMKSNDKESKIGLLAQEILEVFPELVKAGEDKNETLSVNYQGLIPVLINAIKEQQNQIDELKSLLNN